MNIPHPIHKCEQHHSPPAINHRKVSARYASEYYYMCADIKPS